MRNFSSIVIERQAHSRLVESLRAEIKRRGAELRSRSNKLIGLRRQLASVQAELADWRDFYLRRNKHGHD
jgi:hypothetical protein